MGNSNNKLGCDVSTLLRNTLNRVCGWQLACELTEEVKDNVITSDWLTWGSSHIFDRRTAPVDPSLRESIINDLLTALRVMIEHAEETHPHFESERGKRDIAAAKEAIQKATHSK